MDDADQWEATRKLESGKLKYADCDWIRFIEDAYPSQDYAFKELVSLICIPPTFTPGKVIYCYGVPFKKNAAEYHQKLAKEFERIPENVTFMIISKPERISSLYKMAQAMEKKKLAKVEEPLELSKSNAIEWIQSQGQKIGLTIDKSACMSLADLADMNPGRIQHELEKYKHLVSDGIVSPRTIEMAGAGFGRVDIKELGDFILKDEAGAAHEFLQRLLDRGEPGIKICGYLQDWINRLCIAQAAECNFESIRNVLAELKTWEPSSEEAIYETIYDEKWGKITRRKGETAPMFNNPNSLYYSCKALKESNKGSQWASGGIMKMFRVQHGLRAEGASATKILHEFVAELIGRPKNENAAKG